MSTVVVGLRSGRWLLVASGVIALAGATTAPTLGWLAAWSLAPLLLVLAAGAAVPHLGVYLRPVIRVATRRPVLALTFDDGPDPDTTPRVLELLESRGHRATFFVIGQRAAAHPDLVADIARRGHEVANHTWDHSYLTAFRAPALIAADLDRTSATVASATGRRPTWFRAPVGVLSPRIAEATRRCGLTVVHWTATARDGIARTTAEVAVARLGDSLASGAILALHDGAVGARQSPISPTILRDLLPMLDARGLRSVTLSELCAPAPSVGD